MGRVFRFNHRVVFGVGGLPSLGLSILAVLTLSSALLGQMSQGQTSEDSQAVVHLPTDWSHHHLLFSNPATAEQLKRAQQEPRYWQQLFRRSQAAPSEAELDMALPFGLPRGSTTSSASKNPKLKRDWSVNLGSTSATVGAGQYPGKFGFDVTTYSCANDYVVFNTGLAGSATQASIIAYNNLYSGCVGTVPSVYFAYNTGGTITSSVTLSEDGTQLAFVQAQTGPTATKLVLLKWKASTTETANAPTTLIASGSYRGCTLPCETTITFKSTAGTDPTPADTYSAPFYDFSGSDDLYVGDNAGYLHQFTGVFEGITPKENTTAPWPAHVATAPLSSPIYDPTSGNVFVASSYTTSNNGGRIHAVCATSTCAGVFNGLVTTAIGTVTASGILGPDKTAGSCGGGGTSGDGANMRLDSPIVDPVAGMVYAFLGNDGNGNSAVIQLPTQVSSTKFSNQDCGTEAVIGTGGSGVPVFAGTFDNAYFNSSGSSPSGNLYVCGNTSGDATLYRVPIASNAMGTAASVVPITSAGTTCSPVTEVFNSPNDLIFLSAEASGASPACTGGGCIFGTNITPWQQLTAYAVGQEVLDTHSQIQVVETAGTSAAGAPAWSTTIAGTVTDGTVKWLNQGPLSTTITAPAFTPNIYAYGSQVIDGNGNIELCTATFFGFGCLQFSTPTWQTAPGVTTTSGIATWENLGPNGIPALSAAGGTSGIVPDNTVPPGAIGTSQVYYSTLTGGTGVQAAQSGLK
jgi:hypothetical protein